MTGTGQGGRGARGAVSACPGCGVVLPRSDGPAPAGRGASPACWERYGELLARSYGIEAYRPVHQLVVDAYICQHPAGRSRREVQAVAVCLMTLCLFVDDGVDPRHGPALHLRMVTGRPDFRWLEPPVLTGLMTAIDVVAAPDATAHARLAREWSRQVWTAWAPHHATIRAWNAQVLDM